VAAQPVGFTSGVKGAQERIQNLRKSASIPDDQPIVSVEGFIVELLPDRSLCVAMLILALEFMFYGVLLTLAVSVHSKLL